MSSAQNKSHATAPTVTRFWAEVAVMNPFHGIYDAGIRIVWNLTCRLS